MPKRRDVEVDQQAELKRARLEVREDLGGVNCRQSLDGLELYDELVLDEQVELSTGKRMAL